MSTEMVSCKEMRGATAGEGICAACRDRIYSVPEGRRSMGDRRGAFKAGHIAAGIIAHMAGQNEFCPYKRENTSARLRSAVQTLFKRRSNTVQTARRTSGNDESPTYGGRIRRNTKAAGYRRHSSRSAFYGACKGAGFVTFGIRTFAKHKSFA